MVTAPTNVKCPARCSEHRSGASRNRHIHITRGTGPVATTVPDEHPRRLQAVGSSTSRLLFDVPTQFDGERLALVCSSYANGDAVPPGSASLIEHLIGAAFAEGQRSLMGVA